MPNEPDIPANENPAGPWLRETREREGIEHWKKAVATLDYALQPIVNIHSGFTFGFEMLIRNWAQAHFRSIQHVFDAAFSERRLYTLDLLLREKAIEKFVASGFHRSCKMFFNIDNRVLLMPDYSPGNTNRLLGRFGLHPSTVVFELSERHEIDFAGNLQAILAQYRQQSYKIAIDDFGSGYSGLQLLYRSEPEIIKIDRFFIAAIDENPKKRLFVSSVVELAHVLGIQVIAEGVETEAEFCACKSIGCDFVQGYLVQPPVTDIAKLQPRYELVKELNLRDRRDVRANDQTLLRGNLEWVEPILQQRLLDQPGGIHQAFDQFRRDCNHSIFPVVNDNDEPLGIIRERDLKRYVYSRYGKDLLLNRAASRGMMDFVTRCPTAEISSRIDQILEIAARDPGCEGLILTENGRYAGFLGTLALIRAVNERNITMARDQNPLTRLPGNTVIMEQLSLALDETGIRHFIAYFDINHFKAFNDTYGFRLGDRAILLFADILRDVSMNRFFIGHIGGDDFIAIFRSRPDDGIAVLELVQGIVDRFAGDAASLHDTTDRQRGYMEAETRSGCSSRFPLLSVSAGILELPAGRPSASIEMVGTHVAALKKMAKRSVKKIAHSVFFAG